jgi:uncharacterized protein (TIGR01370 family)
VCILRLAYSIVQIVIMVMIMGNFMRALLFLAFSSFGMVMAVSAYGADNEKFAVYYSYKAPVERFRPYQLLVLDRLYHPPLKELAEEGKLLLGYISLGEVEETSTYFPALKRQKLIIQENKNWKGSHVIDLRDPLYRKIVVEEIIPSMLKDGFGGVFLDTLDSPLELERANPAKYKGMKEAAINLIEAIRTNFPTLKIMVNRAYVILPSIASDVDMVLGESVMGEYDFDKKSYIKVEKPLYQEQVKWLQDARQHNPQLKVYTLDYADIKNPKAVSEIYRAQRANGFIPYVASVDLNELVDEPETLKESALQ